MYDDSDFRFQGESEKHLDPRKSERLGYPWYTAPANSTEIPPLPEKEGFYVCFDVNKQQWYYKDTGIVNAEEVAKQQLAATSEIDTVREELYDNMSKLNSTDYINHKISDAINTGDMELAEELKKKYQSVYAERAEWRKKVGQLSDKLAELEQAEYQKQLALSNAPKVSSAVL